jgi:hypothetical protein
MPDSDDIKIDKSVKYKVNAGQCDKCGYFKTWDTRIKNPKTKKSMPAHVTEEGHLVNGGECPYWTGVKAVKDKDKQIHEKAAKEVRDVLGVPSKKEIEASRVDLTPIVDAINNGFAAVVKEIKNLTTEINTLTTVTETRNARLKQIQEMIKDKHVIRYDDLLAKCKEPKENKDSKDSKDSKDGKDSKVDKEDKKTKKGK